MSEMDVWIVSHSKNTICKVEEISYMPPYLYVNGHIIGEYGAPKAHDIMADILNAIQDVECDTMVYELDEDNEQGEL